jgi:dephospho-CoA kinase
MLKVGLTGGIGSGKSTVSSMLKLREIPIIDADVVSRKVLSKYPEIMYNIKEIFGKSFFDCDGNLKRREFGNFLFANKEFRKKYEDIIIPYIKKDIFSEIDKLSAQNEDICILDAATLIENNLHPYMDEVILVWVDLKTQIKRVQIRDKFNLDQVMARINSQMRLDEKKKYASFILDNSKDISTTKKNLENILNKIITKHKGVKCPKFNI